MRLGDCMKHNKSYSMKVVMSVALFLSVIISASLFFIVLRGRVNQVFFTEAFEENSEIAQSAADYFDAKIESEINSIIGIEVVHHNLIGAEDRIFDGAYYETIILQSDYLNRIEVLDLNGNILYSSDETLNREGINISSYYLIESLEGIHQLTIGQLIYDATSENLALEVGYIGEDIIVTGLISIEFFTIYGDNFQESFDNKDLMILNQDGKYLYDSVDNQHLIQNYFQDYDALLENTKSSEFSTFEINDQESILSMEEIGFSDWIIVIYESTDSALYSNTITQNYYAFTITAILALLILVFVFIQFILFKDVHIVVGHLKKFGQGDFTTKLPHSKIKELNVLRSGFNEMRIRLKDSTERLEYLAFHDQLTGLPSKNKAMIDFDDLMKNENVSLLYIDISRFELINDNFGFEFGDQVLKEVSMKIRKAFDYLYRVQSDEFLGIILNKTKEEVFEIAKNILKTLSNGVTIQNLSIPVTINIGMARYPNHGNTYDEIIKKAIMAAHEVKITDNIQILCFDDAQSDKYFRLSNIELEITKALQNRDFTVVYQPIIHVKDHSIRGFEALSRWHHDTLGNVTPNEFIPILERTNKISLLDEQVLNQTLRLNKFIHDEYGVALIASINLSVETIMKDSFTSMIDQTLEKYHYDPNLLELEITESTIIQDFEGISKKIKYLKDKGVKFSEDDFGDAYSSLTYLSRLDIDTLKISRNFLSSILSNVESRVLIQTIVDLSHRLGFFTIVEGIEDQKTLDIFKEYGCDYVQGYLFFKPMPEEDLLDVVKKELKQKG